MNTQRNKGGGGGDQALYRQIFGFANEYKEGDEAIGVATPDSTARGIAHKLLSNINIRELHEKILLEDELQKLIWDTTSLEKYQEIKDWTIGDLKKFLLDSPEDAIKGVMDGLNSDVIPAVVKLMSNPELSQ